MRTHLVGWHALLIAAVACSRSTSPICTQEIRPAIAAYVKNSSTNEGTASGASLVVLDGNYKDSVAAPGNRPDLDNAPLFAAAERAGTYRVTVTKTGFAPWIQNDVRVTANECHVNTVTLTALLQPAS